jgi:hypothetical protein
VDDHSSTRDVATTECFRKSKALNIECANAVALSSIIINSIVASLSAYISQVKKDTTFGYGTVQSGWQGWTN